MHISMTDQTTSPRIKCLPSLSSSRPILSFSRPFRTVTATLSALETSWRLCLQLATTDMCPIIPDPSGSVSCLYGDTGTPPQIVRCTRPPPGAACAPVANLLSGSLVPLSATAWSASLVTPCGAADGPCEGDPPVCSVANQSCAAVPGASVVFTLSDGINNPETFGVTIVASRH